MTATGSKRDFEIRSFRFSYEALGIVLDFLANTKPFTRFESAVLVNMAKYQIRHGYNLYAYRDRTLLGYCGWHYTDREKGEKWLKTGIGSAPVPMDKADAGVLTLVKCEETRVLRVLIRTCRDLNPDKYVFFRRDYGNPSRRERRQSVANQDPH